MDYSSFPLLVALGGALLDLRFSRVHNGWVVGALLGGLVLGLYRGGPRGLLLSLAGALTPLLLLGLLFGLGMMGAGDIKLLMALGSYLGPREILLCIFWALFLGAVYSFILLLSTGTLLGRLRYFFTYLAFCRREGRPSPYREGRPCGGCFPFTLAILGAVLLGKGGAF